MCWLHTTETSKLMYKLRVDGWQWVVWLLAFVMLIFSLVSLVLCAVATCGYTQDVVDYKNYSVVSTVPKTSAQLHALRNLFLKDVGFGLNFWNEPSAVGQEVTIGVPDSALELLKKKLSAVGASFIIKFHDVQRKIEEELAVNQPQLFRGRASTFALDQYHRLEEIQSYLRQLQVDYPNLVTLKTLGQTYENRQIHAVQISKSAGTGDKPVILIDAGIHAREWISPATALYIIQQLVSGYGTNQEITNLISTYDWVIIPVLNPDGYSYTWKTDRLWRKNRSRVGAGCFGVDLNRNFGIGFRGPSTSTNPCSHLYTGSHPFSEAETIALKKITESLVPRLRAAITLHAFGQMWMTPWGYVSSLPKDYNTMISAAEKAVSTLTAMYGTKYRVGPISQVIYATGGGSSDWQYSVSKTPYVYALELRPTQSSILGFELPKSYILPTAKETWASLKALAKHIA